MTAETLSERLLWAMKAKDMTQRALAKAVGIRQQSVWYLLNAAKGVNPRTRYLAKIAEALGVDPIWLETGQGDSQGGKIVTFEGRRIGRRVVIHTKDSFGKKGNDALLQEMTCDLADAEAFGYEVSDDANWPDIRVGDRLLVSPKQAVTPGEYGLFKVDGIPVVRLWTSIGTGKKQRFALTPGNPKEPNGKTKHHPTFDNENNKIDMVGAVVEVRRKSIR